MLVINMADRMRRKGISLDVEALEKRLNTRIALISTRKNTGIETLKNHIERYREIPASPCVDVSVIDPEYFGRLKKTFPGEELYKLWVVITQDVNFTPLQKNLRGEAPTYDIKSRGELKRLQHKETILRYQFINGVLKETYKVDWAAAKGFEAVEGAHHAFESVEQALDGLRISIVFQLDQHHVVNHRESPRCVQCCAFWRTAVNGPECRHEWAAGPPGAAV